MSSDAVAAKSAAGPAASPAAPELTDAELAEKTLETIRSAIRQNQLGAAIPEAAREALLSAGKPETLTAHDLADLIRNDIVLSERVFRMAHAIGFNAGGTQLGNLREAIQLLGFDKVRSLTRTLLAHTHKPSHNSWERKRACLRALITALLAQKMAESTHVCSPDTAFLAVVFREYGRIALATFFGEDYHKAEKLALELGENRAFIQVFGITPLELSHRLIEGAPLSPAILRAVQECPSDIFDSNLMSIELRTLALADTASRFAALALDCHLNEESFREALEVFSQMASPLAAGLNEHFDKALAEVLEHLKALRLRLGPEVVPEHAILALQSRVEKAEPPPPEIRPEPPSPEELERKRREEEEALNISFWQEAYLKLQKMFESGSGQLDAARRHLVASFMQGFHAQESWLFQQSGTDPDTFVVVAGEGRQVQGLIGHAKFNRQETGIFSVSAKMGDNIFLKDLKRINASKYLPNWFRMSIGLSAMMVFSVRAPSGPVGILMVGWNKPREDPLGDVQMETARQMLSLYGLHAQGRL